MRSKMQSTASKGKSKDNSGVRAEQLKHCSDNTNEKSGRSSMKLHDRKTSNRKVGARSESRSSTQKVTEKMQVITGQCAACQYYRNYLPQYYTHVSLHLCTKYNFPTKVVTAQSSCWWSSDGVQSVGATMSRVEGVPLYISKIDLTKAFDRIKHSALWRSLQHDCVEPAYVRLL